MYVTNEPVGEALKLNIENDLLLCCHDRDLKFANFTLPFRRLRQRNTLKYVRAARLFFLIHPMRSLSSDDTVVVVIA